MHIKIRPSQKWIHFLKRKSQLWDGKEKNRTYEKKESVFNVIRYLIERKTSRCCPSDRNRNKNKRQKVRKIDENGGEGETLPRDRIKFLFHVVAVSLFVCCLFIDLFIAWHSLNLLTLFYFFTIIIYCERNRKKKLC